MATIPIEISDGTRKQIIEVLEFYNNLFRKEVESGCANPILLDNLHNTIIHYEKLLHGYYEYNDYIPKFTL